MMTRRLRLALFTPLNPLRSGISDHCEELLPYLAARADVDVVVDGYEPATPHIRTNFTTLTPGEFLPRAGTYDAAVYQIGNNLPLHAYMIPCLRRTGGIVVLQDYCLQHLALGVTAGQGDLQPLVAALSRRHGDQAPAIARRLVLNLLDPNSFSFAGLFAAPGTAFIVHSQCMQDRVCSDYPDIPSRFVPMGVTIPDTAGAPANGLRQRYGVAQDEFVMTSLSTLSAAKRIEILFAALAAVRRRHPRVRLLIVGGGQLGVEAQALADRFDVAGNVIRTGWVSADDYANLTALSDLVLDLRDTSGAETPNSLLRALAWGKPAVVSGYGAFLELPDECCIKVPPAGNQADFVAGVIGELISDPARRARMAAAAGAFARANLSLDRTAAGYVEFIQELRQRGWMPLPAPPGARPIPPVRAAVSGAYKLSRVAYLYRQYGMRGALRRVGSAIRAGS